MPKKMYNTDLVMEQGPALIEFYRNNPCIAAYDLLRVDLAPIQRVVFEDMWFRNYTISICGRGFGKSFLLSLLATLSCLLYPGYKVGLIGPSFRQSKLIFAEVERLYEQAPLLREATAKRPMRGSDTAYLKFKGVGGQVGSSLEAIPIGNDGAKIRGSRFYLICIDELAQVPEKILDMVLRPMGATKQNPMQEVRRLERQAALIAAGLATEDDFEEGRVNKMVMTSSGYYKFNHMYKRMRSYWNKIEKEGYENSSAMVHQIPYWFLPPGFLDAENIAEARRVMSDHEFRMEYEAEMISDSEGFFKASLLESCTIPDGHIAELKGQPGAEYILGIDPNQGGSASCGAVLVKLGNPNKIVNVLELRGKKTQDLAIEVQNLCNKFNIIRICMDQGGGGKAVKDLLEEGYNNEVPILDRADPDNLRVEGKHILEMVNFNPRWISDANFDTLALLEDKQILFLSPDPEGTSNDVYDIPYLKSEDLKKQCLNIVVTQTSSGLLHFDTPKKNQKKDLYSAFILAGYGVKALNRESELEVEPELYGKGGMIRSHTPGSYWNTYNTAGVSGHPGRNLGLAVLKKKIK